MLQCVADGQIVSRRVAAVGCVLKEMNLFIRSILNEFVNAVVGTVLGIVVDYDDADVVSMCQWPIILPPFGQ